jgi:flagellar biosynthesis/type III secretory pathway M-ring protein FliF/YscJ
VGFDEARGDAFEISSQVFGRSTDAVEVKPAPASTPAWLPAATGVGALVVLAVIIALVRRRKKPLEAELVLRPGEKVQEAEARRQQLDGTEPASAPLPVSTEQPVLIDPLADLKDRARAMVRADRDRTLLLIRAWLSADLEKTNASLQGEPRG